MPSISGPACGRSARPPRPRTRPRRPGAARPDPPCGTRRGTRRTRCEDVVARAGVGPQVVERVREARVAPVEPEMMVGVADGSSGSRIASLVMRRTVARGFSRPPPPQRRFDRRRLLPPRHAQPRWRRGGATSTIRYRGGSSSHRSSLLHSIIASARRARAAGAGRPSEGVDSGKPAAPLDHPEGMRSGESGRAAARRCAPRTARAAPASWPRRQRRRDRTRCSSRAVGTSWSPSASSRRTKKRPDRIQPTLCPGVWPAVTSRCREVVDRGVVALPQLDEITIEHRLHAVVEDVSVELQPRLVVDLGVPELELGFVLLRSSEHSGNVGTHSVPASIVFHPTWSRWRVRAVQTTASTSSGLTPLATSRSRKSVSSIDIPNRPLLVVAVAGIDQHRLLRGTDHPGVNAHQRQVAGRIDELSDGVRAVVVVPAASHAGSSMSAGSWARTPPRLG